MAKKTWKTCNYLKTLLLFQSVIFQGFGLHQRAQERNINTHALANYFSERDIITDRKLKFLYAGGGGGGGL